MKTAWVSFLFCWLLLGITRPVFAQQTVQLYDDHGVQPLQANVSFLFEDAHALTIDDILARQEQFKRNFDADPNYGLRDGAVWLRAIVSNVSQIPRWVVRVNFSQFDQIDFYLVDDGKVIAQSHQGKLRGQPFRIPSFNVALPYANQVTLFVRATSQSASVILPLDLSPEPTFYQRIQFESLIWGVFYGGLLILAIYNLVIFIDIRERSLLAYAFYISTVILWQFIWGGHVQLFMPDGLPGVVVDNTGLIFILLGISSGVFTVYFLETWRNAKVVHKPILSLLALQTIIGIVSLFDVLPPVWLNTLVYTTSIIAISVYIYAGYYAFLHHFEPAKYFIFAWTILAAGAITGILGLIGVLPSNVFTSYCFQVGVFFEAGLFSLALMEKSRSQLASDVEQATTDLRNNMELIEEQNARLDIARKEAIKASNVKSQFLANMSHEIRTPLNAILGFSRELNNATLPPEQQEQVRIINTAADNLLSIVNDVLDFSKIEAGKLSINNQPFSPNQLFEEMVSMMSKSAHSKRLEFAFSLQPIPEKLIGDVFRIKQILTNLLTNALKFTSHGLIKFAVESRALPHGIHELTLIVEDTGIGISRTDQKKLFTAFTQVEDAINRSYQGTGLGLVICRELVRLMRGEISMKSAPNFGSHFSVTLRMNQLSQKFALTPSEDWMGKQIVIYDPIPETRRASSAFMKHLGAVVSSYDAIDALMQHADQPDYLFATLPVSRIDARSTVMAKLTEFNAKKRVIWYSGIEPCVQHPSFERHFPYQIRMPYTLSKLNNLIHEKTQTHRNPLQSKLNSLPSARVLAVDDMDMNLKLLRTWLEASPVHLVTATSGQEAVERCQKNEFDLILMDVQMPGMDGLQAAQEIRRTALNLGTPIIAVTAHAFKEEQERLLSSGMDDYLPKPIDITALLELIKRWCQEVEPTAMALPSLDWQLALKRANHNVGASKELMQEFIAMLPDTLERIKQLWNKRDFEGLQAEVHKLNGACCYTGVPKLQDLANQLETALKRDQHFTVAEQLPSFILEAEIVIAEGPLLVSSLDSEFH